MAKAWTLADLGNQRGKTVIITGANSGIGFHTALELGRAGADVIAACRDPERGQSALTELRAQAPGASFRLEALDLADLSSIRAFATRFTASGGSLDVLINNAGVMALPTREQTADGFERQFGTNHLGHFALTGLLLPALERSAAARVVSVSSAVAAWAKLDFGDLHSERRYVPMRAYGQSKLANLVFMLELGRRQPWLTSVAAHPGATLTNLQKYAFERSVKLFGQAAAQGALPSLRAATDAARSGEYFGPKDWFHTRGAPVRVRLPASARRLRRGSELWDASERATAVRYPSGSIVGQPA